MTTENITEKLLDDENTATETALAQEKKSTIYDRKCGAFWTKTGRDGRNYLSGEIILDGKVHQVFIFNNEKKKKANYPDYEMFFQKAPGSKDFI